METTTIYRINETDRTINIAQSVNNDTDGYSVVLNIENVRTVMS